MYFQLVDWQWSFPICRATHLKLPPTGSLVFINALLGKSFSLWGFYVTSNSKMHLIAIYKFDVCMYLSYAYL